MQKGDKNNICGPLPPSTSLSHLDFRNIPVRYTVHARESSFSVSLDTVAHSKVKQGHKRVIERGAMARIRDHKMKSKP